MKCCGKEMFNNTNNYRCRTCGKKIYKICPVCKNKLSINSNNVHCEKCNYRKWF